MEIALYKNVQFGFVQVYEFTEYMEEDEGSVRVSEIIDVEFTSLSESSINKCEIAKMDMAINKYMAETEVKLGELKQRKAELLAITDMSGG